ncbi:MAG: hypothetical protein A2202_08460 [Bdellovibrionales bacterium RIFOXYA1_FULL_36_14]|nr:MAG: hypothetical protein A2202_08460 [Bdellovibrionales bacterium RIFOXYA1_FULL_36_14]
MKNVIVFVLLGFLVCTNLIFSHAFASTDTTVLENLTEHEFYTLVDNISTEKLQELNQLMKDNDQLKGLQKAKKIAIEKLKQIIPFSEFKNLLIKNKTIGIISITSELIGDFVLPLILAKLGLLELAVAVAVVPPTPFILPIYFYFSMTKSRNEMASVLGNDMSRIKVLEKLEKEILDFTVEHRVLSILSDELENDQEFVVIKQTFLEKLTGVDIPKGQVGLKQLEKIFVKHYSSNKLKMIKEASEQNDSIYTQLVLNYLKNNQEAKQELTHYLAQQSQLFMGDRKFDNVKKYLIEIDNKQKLIEMKIIEYRKNIKALKSREPFFYERPTTSKKVKDINQTIEQLKSLALDLRTLKYRYLAAIDYDLRNDNAGNVSMDINLESSKLQRIMDRFQGITQEKSWKVNEGTETCLELIHQLI